MKDVTQIGGFAEAYARRVEPEAYRAFAMLYWLCIIILATIAVLASVAFGAWQFLFAPQEAVPEAASGGIVGFNRD